ncbi:hypothetical protein THAOC_33365 [Thalassiosira oceanica]|uniref:Uncharacterized protein n=1 Tax=Thalassiosira oceanica TaxID=159749 RepID=K0R4A1_THAOC|nr:hypothetical protein THAOC_33365 [Thalassiosira oceanica]|eukprot:EJK47888.1 hypothetical protein THAOC_33365 [Thalassiosira oceanica]
MNRYRPNQCHRLTAVGPGMDRLQYHGRGWTMEASMYSTGASLDCSLLAAGTPGLPPITATVLTGLLNIDMDSHKAVGYSLVPLLASVLQFVLSGDLKAQIGDNVVKAYPWIAILAAAIEIGTARTIAVGQELMPALTQDEEGGAFQSFARDEELTLYQAGTWSHANRRGWGARRSRGWTRQITAGPAMQAIDD